MLCDGRHVVVIIPAVMSDLALSCLLLLFFPAESLFELSFQVSNGICSL